MDLPRLNQDLPKYFSAGVLHDEAKLWWDSFLFSFESMYGTTPTEFNWPVDMLLGRVRDPAEQTVPVIPTNIAAIYKTQMETRPQVL